MKASGHKPPKGFSRADRVGDAIHRAIAGIIRTEFTDPRVGLITISHVRITPDLKNARIYVTVLEEDKIAITLKILNDAQGFFRHQLADAVHLRVVPKVEFIFDESVIRGTRIETLLESIHEPKKS